jgi:hypothetical protein
MWNQHLWPLMEGLVVNRLCYLVLDRLLAQSQRKKEGGAKKQAQ